MDQASRTAPKRKRQVGICPFHLSLQPFDMFTSQMTYLCFTECNCSPVHHTTPYHTTPHHTMPRHTTPTLHHTTLYHTTLHYTTLHYTTLHYTTPHHTTPHHTTPHHTTLHHNTLSSVICSFAQPHPPLFCSSLFCCSLLFLLHLAALYSTHSALICYSWWQLTDPVSVHLLFITQKVESKPSKKVSRKYVRIEKVVDKRSECCQCKKPGDNSTLVR